MIHDIELTDVATTDLDQLRAEVGQLRSEIEDLQSGHDEVREGIMSLVEGLDQMRQSNLRALAMFYETTSKGFAMQTNNLGASVEIIGAALKGLAASAARPVTVPTDNETDDVPPSTVDAVDLDLALVQAVEPLVRIALKTWRGIGDQLMFSSDPDEAIATYYASVGLVELLKGAAERFVPKSPSGIFSSTDGSN